MGDMLSIEQVLVEEADAIHGADWHAQLEIKGQDAQQQRAWLNADDRDAMTLPPGEAERRAKLYRALNKLNRSALCFSGGGIRSATFCLGVLQALANYDTAHPRAAAPAPGVKPKVKPEDSLLGCFDFLSTVSGGGYIGSWLSSWRSRCDFPTVVDNLTHRPDGADVEPPEISWLRAYSNYLTPRLGIASADSWAAVAICVRNLVLNWLVIIPTVCVVLLLLKLVATGGVWVARGLDDLAVDSLMAGVIFLVVAQSFTNSHRPTRRRPTRRENDDPDNSPESIFLLRDFTLAFASAIFLTIFLASHYYSIHVFNVPTNENNWIDTVARSTGLAMVVSNRTAQTLLVMAAAGLFIYLIGWVLARRLHRTWPDLIFWAISGLAYGALIGVGASLYQASGPYGNWPKPAQSEWYFLIPIIFGVPWVLMAQLIADNIFIGLASYEIESDSDREWLGRAAGWLAAGAIAWALTAFLVFAGEYSVSKLLEREHYLVVAAGGVTGLLSGIISALLGSSSKTPAKSNSDDQNSTTAIALNVVIAIAGPLFAAALIVGLSIGLDQLLLGKSLVGELKSATINPAFEYDLFWLGFGLVVALIIGSFASYFVNINRFSLHALYRNRLIRAYLGASRPIRHPDLFTGFDIDDNVRMHELWPPLASADGQNSRSLFHVVNIALNVVATKRKAWQQRKAEPFTVTSLHSGSAYLGYRSNDTYGDGEHADKYLAALAAAQTTDMREFGITLGTAMAISGAAVSPNMGYYSSPSITLLLTLFNVRLGWWLGNPGKAGDRTYKKEGPEFAIWPLIVEAFGETTDQRGYVYLSDGGHFEDLGLYEMVRRRCRFIILIDAGGDPEFAFEDLGNAVRKISIDLGITIKFEGLKNLRNRPSKEEVLRDFGNRPIPYCAIGVIDYKNADGADCENGHVIYIKPAYHETEEGAGIRSYAQANPTFPHESTVDQWFTESQFESYRSLGAEIADVVLREDANAVPILKKFVDERRAGRGACYA